MPQTCNFVKKETLTQVFFLKACNFMKKKTPAQVFSCEMFKNLKNTYFEEHLRTTAPESLRKISSLLVLGKPLLDGKRHN